MTTTPEHRVEPGQEYETHDGRENTTTTIRVTSRPYPGPFGEGKADIATVAPSGRLVRPRSIALRQLRPADWTGRAGYRLVRHPDGTPTTPAGGDQQ